MRLRKPEKEKPTLVNLKVLRVSLKKLNAKAKKYTGGNLSLWLRYAGENHIPKRKDLV